MGLAPENLGGQAEATALKQGLQALGWAEGRNLQIEFSWPGGIRASAKKLVGLRCEVIVARSTPVVSALLTENRTVPIVFVIVVDPVGSGFVASLARPGGNVTGFQNYEFTMGGKWLEILKQVAPSVSRVAMVYNPTTAPLEFIRLMEAIAPSLGLQPVHAAVHKAAEIDGTIGAFAGQPGGGMVVVPDIFTVANRARIIASAAKPENASLPTWSNLGHNRLASILCGFFHWAPILIVPALLRQIPPTAQRANQALA